jgi:predicted acyl esterase
MRLPLTGYPDFATWQPFLDEIITHPAPDPFRTAHNFRRTIEIPGFHVTTWFDIFQTSVIRAFNDIQARVGNQLLWIGPNEHYFVYHRNFWPGDPYFAWFDYWLKDEPIGVMDRPAVFSSPRAWVDDRESYVPDDWRYAERWPLQTLSHNGSICALMAASVVLGRKGRRAAIVMTRAGRSRPWVGATC